MNEERFSIGELATAAATTPRTIRFYTTEGILPPPLTEGRNAIYSEAHRRRLRLIQRLKAAYLPLSAIKAQLAGLTDEQVDGLLERGGAHRVENIGGAHVARPQSAQVEPSNVAYVAQILAAAQQVIPAGTSAEAGPPPRRVMIVSPLLRPDSDGAAASAERSIERWQRIEIRPGIELHIREPIAVEESDALNQLTTIVAALLGRRA